jgi:hypothetical protein
LAGGKTRLDGKGFWFQTNSEYPDREIAVNITCPHKPVWRIEPAAAAVEARWDEGAKTLRLRLSHQQGAVEGSVH